MAGSNRLALRREGFFWGDFLELSSSPLAASTTARGSTVGSVGFLPGSFLSRGFRLIMPPARAKGALYAGSAIDNRLCKSSRIF
jgi:hypothetical protein